MAKVIPIQDWLTSLEEAATEVAGSTLRFDGTPGKAEPSEERPGAYIALMNETHSIHLGLNATPDGCRRLARGFLGLRSDQPVDEKDVADGVREVMNIVAGKVKSKMSGKSGVLQLGLPMFLAHPSHAGEGAESAAAEVKLGEVDCRLVVYRSKRAA
jgi:hypothetical protein